MKKIKKQRNPIRMKKKAIAFKIATVILVIILVPIWPVRALTLSAANSNSFVESTELLSVTALVDGNEEAAAEAPADSVLSAAIEGKVPEGSLVSYQWQMAYELASKEASDITSTPPSSTEETSDVTSAPPVSTEAASDITSSSPSTTEVASDVTSSSPSTTEAASDVTSSSPSTTEASNDITSSSPSTTEASNDITSSSPSISEEVGDTPSTPSASGERAGDVTSPPPASYEMVGNVISAIPASTEMAGDVTSPPPASYEMAGDVISATPASTEMTGDITGDSSISAEEAGDITGDSSIPSEEADDITSTPPASTEAENTDSTVETAKWFDIPGATNSTYTLTPDEEGCYVRCAVAVTPPQSKLRTVAEEDKLIFSNAVLVSASAETRDANKIYVGSGGSNNNDGFTEDTKVATLYNAISKVKATGTIVVTSDISTDGINIGKTVTIEGNADRRPVISVNGRITCSNPNYATMNFKNIILDGQGNSGKASQILCNVAHVSLDNTTLQNFSSPYGALYLQHGSFKMLNGSKIIKCENTSAPGTITPNLTPGLGIVTVAIGTMSMNGEGGPCEISDCKTKGPASAVYLAGTFDTGPNIKISNNTTTAANAGAVYATSSSKMNIGYNTVISGNTIKDGEAGNVYLSSGAKISLKANFNADARIGVRTAVSAVGTSIATGATTGGVDYLNCVFMDDNTLRLKKDGSELKVTSLASTLTDVYVKADAIGGDGTKDKPLATLRDAYVVANDNANIFVMGNLETKVSAPFNENKTVILKGSTADGNTEQQCTITRADGYRGNMIEVTAGNVTLNNVILDGNSIPDAGDGISAVNSTLTMENGSSIKNNSSTSTGGGISAVNSTLTMKNGSDIIGNTSANSGGGIDLTNSTLTMESGSSITDNEAGAHGGGINATNSTLNINAGSKITENTVVGNGGGVFYVANTPGATFELKGTISNNTASSGGGVYANGVVNISENGSITENSAKTNAGGIFVAQQTTTVSGSGTISKNTAAANGGGVVVTNGTLTLSDGDGTITANEAQNNGGGVYQAGGIINLKGGSITDNNAIGANSVGDGIYVNGVLNVSGDAAVTRNTPTSDPTDDNIFLTPGKSLNVVDELTGAEGALGVSLSDRPLPNRSRIFAINTKSDMSAEDAKKFSLDNPYENGTDYNESDPYDRHPEIKAEGANLEYTFYSCDSRLSVLERGGFAVAGEVTAIPAENFKGNGTGSDNTTTEKVTLEIPYSVNTKTTIDVTAVTNDYFAKVAVSGFTAINRSNEPPAYAPSNRLTISVPYDPTTISAGGEITFTITVTSQYGTPAKKYEVTVKRGMPTISGNDTATFNFDKDLSNPQEHFIIIDKLRSSTSKAAISKEDFAIRAANAAETDAAVTGVTVVGFDNQTGKLQMQMTKAYTEGKVTETSLGIFAGKQPLSLWVKSGIKSYKLGTFVVNMTVVDNKMLAAFVEISHLDWGTVYPKNAYIRAEDKPQGENAWPLDGENLFEENEYGKWGEIGPDDKFEEIEEEEAQSAWIKGKLEEYASKMVKTKITGLAEKHKITLPNYNIIFETSEYQAAENATPISPKGIHGKYTFRVDLEILKDNGDASGVTVAGQQHYVTVVTRKFDGIPEEKLYQILQNEEKNGALDGTLSGSIWVEETASEDDVFAAIKEEFLTKDGSAIKRRLEWLKGQPEYQGYTFEPYFETEMVEAHDGPHFLISLTIRAYKTNCPKYNAPKDDEDGNPTGETWVQPEPKYTSFAAVEIPLNVEVRHNMTVPQLLATQAVKDIRKEIDEGRLSLADVSSASSKIGNEAAAKNYVREKILAGVTTLEGITLTSEVGNKISYTLENPLRDMITITVSPRAIDVSGAYVPVVDGTQGNPNGIRGQYGFKIDILAEVSGNAVGNNKSFTATLPLDFGGSSVKAVSDGGSARDDGIVLMPVSYNPDGSSNGGSKSPSSGTSSVSAIPKDVPKSKVPSLPQPEDSVSMPTKPKKSRTPQSGSVTIPSQSRSKAEDENDGEVLSEKGNVKISVLPSNSVTAKLADLDAVLKAVLTPEELKAVQAGEKVEVELKITDIENAAVPQDEKKLIKERASKEKLELGLFVDIQMKKRVGEGDWVNITEMASSILVEMVIPDSLHSEGRVFSMAHNHGGKVNIYPNISKEQNTLAFETERFSTFAIVYKDITVSNHWIVYLAAGVLVAGIIVVLIVWKSKKRR